MKLAVIADDFTGGADAASFLKRKSHLTKKDIDTFNVK